MYTTLSEQDGEFCISGNSQKVNQILYIPKDVQILLNRLSNTLCKSKSQIVADLIETYADTLGKNNLVESKKASKCPPSRFDVVRSTILPKLYDATGEDAFTYAIYKRFMAQPPISVIREYTINEYLHRMISLGYVISCEDEVNWRYKPQNKIFSLESRFMLSDSLIKAQGRLEGLQ